MIYIDLESFNADTDISAGVYEYARTAEVLLIAWALDEGPVRVWDLTSGEDEPDLLDALCDPERTITAHNAQFDRIVLREQAPALSLPDHVPDPARWRCTMCKGMAHGFPGALDQVGRILGLPQEKAKLADGKKLIRRFCLPAPRNHKARRYDRLSHPEEWERFKEYAARDVEALREIDRRLPDWNFRGEEVALYHLDQRINDRGFLIDRALAEAGAAAADAEQERMAARLVELTGGEVARPTMREALRQYVNTRFALELPNSQAPTLRAVIADPATPEAAREILRVAVAANKTSTAKYKALVPAIGPDDRFRGGLQFCGAARTRRWSGRLFQPQNLPSRGLPPQSEIEQYIRALKSDAHDLLFDDLMLLGSAALRGVVVAPPERKLVVADLSNIEGRANAWLAGESWKIDAFRAFDRGDGPDLYNVTAGALLGKKPDAIDRAERDVMGKVPELALGYQGGFGAFQTFTRAYGIRMADYADTIRANMGRFTEAARNNYETWGRDRAPDAEPAEWIATETVKLAWRDRHKRIAALWHACEDAARAALSAPGTTHKAGPLLLFKYVRYHGADYLLCRLPSGRFLTYFAPRVSDDGALSYMALNGLTRQWARQGAYGGLLVENACQSVSRDVMASAMPGIEAAGYDILFTVHDEIVTETPDSPEFTAGDLAARMASAPAWAAGFPLAAAGFEARRYRRD